MITGTEAVAAAKDKKQDDQDEKEVHGRMKRVKFELAAVEWKLQAARMSDVALKGILHQLNARGACECSLA